MKKLYSLTLVHTVYNGSEFYRTDTVLVGFENDLDKLEKAVTSNAGDMFECFYHYAVIEEVAVEALSSFIPAPIIQWYEAVWKDGENGPSEIVKCSPPEWSERIFNWWS